MKEEKISEQIESINSILPEKEYLEVAGEKIELPKRTLRLKLEITRLILKMMKLIGYDEEDITHEFLGLILLNDEAYVLLQEAVILASGRDDFMDIADIEHIYRILVPFFGIALGLSIKKETLEKKRKKLNGVDSSESAQSISDGQ